MADITKKGIEVRVPAISHAPRIVHRTWLIRGGTMFVDRGQGWTLHYAVFARRGFTAEAHSEAARHKAILVDAAQLDADLR